MGSKRSFAAFANPNVPSSFQLTKLSDQRPDKRHHQVARMIRLPCIDLHDDLTGVTQLLRPVIPEKRLAPTEPSLNGDHFGPGLRRTDRLDQRGERLAEIFER